MTPLGTCPECTKLLRLDNTGRLTTCTAWPSAPGSVGAASAAQGRAGRRGGSSREPPHARSVAGVGRTLSGQRGACHERASRLGRAHPHRRHGPPRGRPAQRRRVRARAGSGDRGVVAQGSDSLEVAAIGHPRRPPGPASSEGHAVTSRRVQRVQRRRPGERAQRSHEPRRASGTLREWQGGSAALSGPPRAAERASASLAALVAETPEALAKAPGGRTGAGHPLGPRSWSAQDQSTWQAGADRHPRCDRGPSARLVASEHGGGRRLGRPLLRASPVVHAPPRGPTRRLAHSRPRRGAFQSMAARTRPHPRRGRPSRCARAARSGTDVSGGRWTPASATACGAG
jgi:hypothetical protein